MQRHPDLDVVDSLDLLSDVYGPVARDPLPLGNKPDVVDELIYISLTLMTRSQPRIDRAFEGLRSLAPRGWSQLLECDRGDVTAVLRPLGFAERRTGQLLGMLREPLVASADASNRLAALDDADLLAALTALPGIGIKSAKCAMMYSLGREVLPVDVHVARVAERLGLLPPGLTLLQADAVLEHLVPPGLRFDVHVQFVRHGRDLCRKQSPRCSECPLAPRCPAALVSDA